MLLDHVLHPPTRAVELFVEVLCPAAGDVGDDEPGLDADTASGFDASDDPAFLAPTPGGVIGLEKAAYAVLVMDRPARGGVLGPWGGKSLEAGVGG